MFDARIIPAVIIAAEFCQPQIVIVLHHGFGARAAHRCAQQQKLMGLRDSRPGKVQLIGNDGVCRALELFKIERAVEFAPFKPGL